ncbi:MAG: LysM peptidoglycan-binding domain-containing protein [Bacteroidia bacterium]|nr:LysM peptidoglycan-binding domain-containing protein [Bacteroidia bacterium]
MKHNIYVVIWLFSFLAFGFPVLAQTVNSDTCYRSVLKGENLFDIAKEYSVTVNSICKLNNIEVEDTRIYPGQQLKIVVENNVTQVPDSITGIAEAEAPLRRLFLVTIGVDSIQKKRGSHLKYTVKGALDVQTFFELQEGSIYSDVITLSITGFPTKREILEQIKNFAKKIESENDVFVLYIGSHARNDSVRNEFWMMPYDFDDSDTLTYMRSAISAAEMLDAIRTPSHPDGTKILLLDICNSEGFMLSVAKSAIQEMEVCIMAACGKDEIAYETDKWDNSAFVYALLETQSPEFRQMAQKWSVKQLFEFIRVKVEAITEGDQKPKLILNTPFDDIFIQSN